MHDGYRYVFVRTSKNFSLALQKKRRKMTLL
jgi:hypothetical protein